MSGTRVKGARTIATLALALAACVSLPKISSDECGNGVIEPPEDCDSFGHDAGAFCRPKGAVGECHLDCSATGAGHDACPAGWGCDRDGLCRRPTGELEAPREFDVGTAALLASGDFDGDGRGDVMSAEPPDPFGVTRIQFHYFDERGELTDTRLFPHLLFSPVLARMDGDAIDDVVFTEERVGLLLGRADRSWVPETFSSYRFPDTAIRTLAVRDAPVEQTNGFLVFVELDEVSGAYVPDPANGGQPRLLGALPGPVEQLAGDPVAGQVIEGAACRQAIVAFEGESRFSMFDVCAPGPDGAVLWRPEMLTQVVELDPPEPITRGPQVVDMNGDGHLDVIIGTAERTFVAQGDGQALATAVPYVLTPPGAEPLPNVPMPLAVGDVTGDALVDFVFSGGVWLSAPSSLGQSVYAAGAAGQPRWTAAVIANLNSGSDRDLLVGSSERPGLTFFNGTGTSDLTFFSIPTSRPVQRLAVGDFDGDGIEDVAFTQDSRSEVTEVAVMVAFGAPFGPPLPAVAVARLPNVEQLMSLREGRLSHLLIASSEGTGPDRRGVLTVLTGNGERLPMALYELTTFAADSSINGSLALRAIGGAFTSTARGDVLSVGASATLTDEGLDFWLLRQLGSSPGSPQRLAGALPADVHPFGSSAGSFTLAAVAVDLDADGRDEAVLAAPAEDAEHCALLVLQVEPERVIVRSDVRVAEPCARVEISPVHADADGHLDIAWLTGRADGSDRQLSIFWNDGAGALSAEQRSVVSDRAASPQAFALLPGNVARGAGLVYAAASGLERVAIAGDTRELGPAEPLSPLVGCTGLTATDVNGDGAIDLVAAARGNLHLFEASLEAL